MIYRWADIKVFFTCRCETVIFASGVYNSTLMAAYLFRRGKKASLILICMEVWGLPLVMTFLFARTPQRKHLKPGNSLVIFSVMKSMKILLLWLQKWSIFNDNLLLQICTDQVNFWESKIEVSEIKGFGMHCFILS